MMSSQIRKTRKQKEKIRNMQISAAAVLALVCLVSCTSNADANLKPNFIVMQPDDLQWLEAWGNNAHFDTGDSSSVITTPELSIIPNIERLRNNGLQMTQASTASPMCGPSRYSTITGRYPSRAAYSRDRAGSGFPYVQVQTSKLEDIDTIEDGMDCSQNNIAVAFKENGYQTGVVGKWHLSQVDRRNAFNYTEARQGIRDCGFDFAEAIYPENLGSGWVDDYEDVDIDHNMEHVTAEALSFMESAIADGDPFFLYLNPTVPHDAGNVRKVLKTYDCRHTVAGVLSEKPSIKYGAMAGTDDDEDCSTYRASVVSRTGGSREDHELGMVWIDDAVESILLMLEDKGQLDNTFILFQMDHGEEGKTSLYQPGIRMAQFIHYPDAYGTEGTTFDGLVSTIDIGPTLLSYAGIDQPYDMDGQSWKDAAEGNTPEEDWTQRCIVAELDFDVAIRCGCDKLIAIGSDTTSGTATMANTLGYTLNDEFNLYDVCSGAAILEQDGTAYGDDSLLAELESHYYCHIDKVDAGDTPDYTTACWDSNYEDEEEETAAPCADTVDPIYTERPDGSIASRTCAWVEANGRCVRFGDECPVTCGTCP